LSENRKKKRTVVAPSTTAGQERARVFGLSQTERTGARAEPAYEAIGITPDGKGEGSYSGLASLGPRRGTESAAGGEEGNKGIEGKKKDAEANAKKWSRGGVGKISRGGRNLVHPSLSRQIAKSVNTRGGDRKKLRPLGRRGRWRGGVSCQRAARGAVKESVNAGAATTRNRGFGGVSEL